MYLEFYGLKEPPFNITPDPRFIYFSPEHQTAYDHLMYGVAHRKGFIALVGEVGAGKTTLCRSVLASLPMTVQTALVLNPAITANQLLRAILQDFGIEPRGRDRLNHISQLNNFLLDQMAEGNNVVLIIDEAQDLTPQVLEEVRLLNNLETDQYKLLQIILSGQPELQKRLNRQDLRQLKQRIMVRCELNLLKDQDIGPYVHHRLKVAGGEGRVQFDSSALKLVHRASDGTPRKINTICDNALLAGYVASQKTIRAREVKKALKNLGDLL